MEVSEAIVVDKVIKTFGAFRALDELDLTVDVGEIHGFLGPNGSGKSTTIRILLGLLRYDQGRARLLGGDPWADAVQLHRRLAYVPGEVDLWPKLTGGEIIDLFGRLRGNINTAKRAELIDRFELDPTKKARTYSKGNRQKVGLIAALASDVELLVLDEPTSGLDPLMESEFQAAVRDVNAQGCTVLLSSHILAEVEALCDRVTIIRSGRTVESGSLADLRHVTRTAVTATTERAVDLSAIDDVRILGHDENRISFEIDNASLPAAIAVLTASGLLALTATPPTLEEMFLDLYDEPSSPAPEATR